MNRAGSTWGKAAAPTGPEPLRTLIKVCGDAAPANLTPLLSDMPTFSVLTVLKMPASWAKRNTVILFCVMQSGCSE